MKNLILSFISDRQTQNPSPTRNHDYWENNLHTLTEPQRKMYDALKKLMNEGKHGFFTGDSQNRYITFPLSNKATLLFQAYKKSFNMQLEKSVLDNLDEQLFSKLDEEYTSEALSCLVNNYWDTVILNVRAEKEKKRKQTIEEALK